MSKLVCERLLHRDWHPDDVFARHFKLDNGAGLRICPSMSFQVREPQLPLGLGVVRIVNDAFIFGADQFGDGLIWFLLDSDDRCAGGRLTGELL